jgi:glutamate racemase
MTPSYNLNEYAIGIFDSGIGGLTVLREIKRHLPSENIIYLGDTARVPYGTRSAQTVLKYSIANTDFLLKQNIKLLIIACNTASAIATEALRKRYAIPVVEVITPGARGAARATRTGKVGVIGTEATIKSAAYQKAIKELRPDIDVVARPCPMFVPLAEEGWCDPADKIVNMTASRYLEELKHYEVDTLVLGCTHYPLLKGAIQSVMGDGVTLIDSAEETAKEVSILLNDSKLRRTGTGQGICSFFVTDIPHRFIETGKLFLGNQIESAQLVDIL